MMWVVVCLIILLGVRLLMPALISFLHTKAVLDMPNARSSHSIPTPRGGGWLALGIPLIALVLFLITLPFAAAIKISLGTLAASLCVLMIVSGFDDKWSLTPCVRLLVHFVASVAIVMTLPDSVRVFPDMPLLFEQIVLVLGCVWMINLTNFVDGINGITAVNGLSLALGLAIAACLMPVYPSLNVLLLSAALIAGGLGGFLYWNAPNARIFMGDVGSVPLGLWQAYALIFFASIFGVIPALLLCLYPLTDATFTLFKRALQRQKIWEAHRSHFYQQAVQNGRTHIRTSKLIFGFNLFCLFLMTVSVLYPVLEYACVGIAAFALVILMREFARPLSVETSK